MPRVVDATQVPRVPVTLPVADKVPVPRHQRFLGGFQCTSYEEIITLQCVLAVCYPAENPLPSGGRAGRSPRGGSRAVTRSSGLMLSTGGLHYTILRFIVHTTTLLNTYTSQWKPGGVGAWHPPLNMETGDTCPVIIHN